LKYLNIYIDKVNVILSDYNLPTNKMLLLPRNNIDNYVYNVRNVPGIEDIEKNIINNGGTVLNTYQINNLYLQFLTVKHSDIIILDYGSSYFFNCLFIKNKKIILLNNHHHYYYHMTFLSYKNLNEIITSNNKVVVITPKQGNIITYNDIKEYLCE